MLSPPGASTPSTSRRTRTTPEQVPGEDLIRRHRQTGDPRWRTRAIESYLPLAHKLARRYHPSPEPLDDLVQVACVGLVKAIDRFDPDAGHRFASYAIPTITGELRRHFRDTTWSVHVPRGVQENALRLRHATAELSERSGRAPTVRELTAATGLDEEQIVEALHATTAKDAMSLERPLRGGAGGDDDGGATIGDTIACDERGFHLAEHRTAIEPGLRALSAQEREILHMRFEEDMTQLEIAGRIGCSQMQISRVLRRTLEKLAG